MTEEESFKFYETHKTVEHSRPEWKNEQFWKDKWKEKDVCVICCQRKTKTAIQMTLESLLRYYPDIPIIISDNDSLDDSAQYLQYKELVTPNLFVWMRTDLNSGGRSGHGTQLHEMIEKFVRTKYCLMLDSDVIIEKPGFIEEMIAEFEKDDNLYAIGTMHYGSYKGNGGEPESEEDAVPYPHPQTSMIRIDKYNELNVPFLEDGAPLILNMKAAKDKKWRVAYYPTDKYVSHRGGSSYVEPRPIWSDDHDVFLRPFVTFIINHSQMFLIESIDSDFDVVIAENSARENVVIHGREPQLVWNDTYKIRFQVVGEYVCDARDNFKKLPEVFIRQLKDEVIKQKAPDILDFDGLTFIKRKHWQKNQSLL